MIPTIYRLAAFAALTLLSTVVVRFGSVVLLTALPGPLEDSGWIPWFVWCQWAYESLCLAAIGYFLPRILRTEQGVRWAAALGIVVASLRWLSASYTVYVDLGLVEYLLVMIHAYGGYFLGVFSAAAGAWCAQRGRRAGSTPLPDSGAASGHSA